MKRKAAKRDEPDFTLHEVLHGSYLVMDLLGTVGQVGDADRVFREYPEVRAAYDRAIDALNDLYQAAGRADLDPVPPAPRGRRRQARSWR